ncbi:MAG TPA: hypothetical protein VFV38_52880 [Ktedonobacteraceae bacterium]|nr:hypothetical protein [Ktedonobacteraceae bacterium]
MEPFGRRCQQLASAQALLNLEQQAERSEQFQTVDRLVGALLQRCFQGETLAVVAGDNIEGWRISLQGLSAQEHQILEELFRLEHQQARGAWFIPKDAELAVGMSNLPALYRACARFAGGIAREQSSKIALGQNPDALLHWAVLTPLFSTLFLPIELRGRQAGKYTPEEEQALWAKVEAVLEAMGLVATQEIQTMRATKAWIRLRAQGQMQVKLQYLATLAQQIHPQMAARFRAQRLLSLITHYYQKAKDGFATRKQVLTKPFAPILAAYFCGDWLAWLSYLGERPHPDEEIVTALPETKLYVGGRERATQVASQLGLPASEVEKIAAAFWQQEQGHSPIEQRVAVLERFWHYFDTIHAQQQSGMKPLWGLIDEGILDLFPQNATSPYQPGLYRQLLPGELLDEICQLWGTMMLPSYPDRLISEPFPYNKMAELLGPALRFWQGCALTAWFVCEGPSSRTDMAGLRAYHQRDIGALEARGTPIDEQFFADLIEAEARLGPAQPIIVSQSTQTIREQVTLTITTSSGSKRAGFEHLRDVVTRYRRDWTQRYWNAYVRGLWEPELQEASRAFHQQLANTSRTPHLKQFVKVATVVTNHWFGGDLSGLYRTLGEKAPAAPTRAILLPTRVVEFVRSFKQALQVRAPRLALLQASSPPSPDETRQAELTVIRLAQASLGYVQLWEALDREPTLKEFGRNKFEWQAPWLHPDIDAAWMLYTTTIRTVLEEFIGSVPL